MLRLVVGQQPVVTKGYELDVGPRLDQKGHYTARRQGAGSCSGARTHTPFGS